jgi:hypothetical protein
MIEQFLHVTVIHTGQSAELEAGTPIGASITAP